MRGKGKGGKAQASAKSKTQDGFARWYQQNFPKPDDVVRIFERKDLYSVHGKEATWIAQEYFRTLAAVTNIGASQLPTVEMKQEKFEEVVRSLLLVKQRKVEIWGKKGQSSWVRLKKGSPGNIQDFEELLWRNREMTESNVSFAVCFGTQEGQKLVGVAFADATLRTLGFCQFIDNLYLSNLEAALLQTGAKECIVPKETKLYEVELNKLAKLLERCEIPATEVARAYYKSDDLEQDLARLLVEGSTKDISVLLNYKLGMASLACLLHYLELGNNEDNFHQFELVAFDLSKYMRLDQSASRALNLFPAPTDADKNFSLFGLLNSCKTPMGSRRLMQWIKQPLLDIEEIRRRQDVVEIFSEDTTLRMDMQSHFKRIPDLERLTKKFQRKRILATLKDCVMLYDVANQLPTMRDTLNEYNGDHKELLHQRYIAPIEQLITDFLEFNTLIEGTIDMTAVQNHEYIVNPSFDVEFTKCCEEKEKLKYGIEALARQVQAELGTDPKNPVTLEYSKMWEWHLLCPKKFAKKVKGKKGYTILEDTAKGLKVTTAQLSRLSKKYVELETSLQEKQSKLIAEIIEVVSTYAEVMESLTTVIAELDVLISFAHVGVNAPTCYVRPTLTEAGTGDIILCEARHPCLEVQEGVRFIPNNVKFIRDESMFQIITGPNMGGKSTYIRQTGVIILMAQIGCFVPCSSASICLVDCIMSRIGASDSQLRGVSTFMAEMQETAAILKAATPRSLIIIDELGRGTSTYDGFGLAWAISEYICKKIGCFCFFATHFHELTALAEHIPIVKNLHVTAETAHDRLVLLYHIEEGPSDRSFGIQIAELAGFPQSVLEVARRKVEVLESSAQQEKATAVQQVGTSGSSTSTSVTGKRPQMEAPTPQRAGGKVAHGAPPAPKKPCGPSSQQQVRDFLTTFKNMPLDTLSPAEAMARLATLRQEMLTSNNPLIKAILKEE